MRLLTSNSTQSETRKLELFQPSPVQHTAIHVSPVQRDPLRVNAASPRLTPSRQIKITQNELHWTLNQQTATSILWQASLGSRGARTGLAQDLRGAREKLVRSSCEARARLAWNWDCEAKECQKDPSRMELFMVNRWAVSLCVPKRPPAFLWILLGRS